MATGSEILIERQKKLGAAIKEAGLAGMALNPGPSLRYLTGLEFHLSERPVIGIFTPSSPMSIILPELEAMKTEGVGYEIETVSYPEEPTMWSKAIESGVKAARLEGDAIGVEQLTFRVMEMGYLKAAMPNGKIISVGEIVAALRMRKDADEIAKMRAAADIAQKALEDALLKVKIGMTEREVAAEITGQLFRHGSGSSLPFSPIVSSGPNSANPHAFPSERKLADGDLLVIDWGASVDGYFSDITRTFAVGEVQEEYAKIHQIVQAANAAARATVRPGVSCHEVDKAARDVIEKAGYGEYFIHRTGHGLGMESHEEPYMRADNPMKLEAGMTFTIEPGIYLSGRGGVRIEDDVIVTEDGMESLTDMPRGMSKIG